MKSSNQPKFANFLSRQGTNHRHSDNLTPSRSQKRLSTCQQPQTKPYEGLASRRAARPSDTARDTSQDGIQERLQERISASPLKLPLSRAIEKTVKNMNDLEKSRRAYQQGPPAALGRKTLSKKYSTHDQSSYFLKQDMELDEVDLIMKHMHHQTVAFLTRYFEPSMLGEMPLSVFVDKVIEEHQNLWNNEQAEGTDESNAEILGVFIQRMHSMLGGDILDLRLLQVLTKDHGIIGLILRIFKELKQEGGAPQSPHHASMLYSPANNMSTLKKSFEERLTSNSSDIQNIKNIIQEFMESMYKMMENEIYSKFNVEMRRMMLKYKEADKILKTVNEKINLHIDVFDAEQKRAGERRAFEAEIQDGRERLQKQEILLEKEKLLNKNLRADNEKLGAEVRRLSQSLDRYQNHILKQTEYDPTQSRQVSLPVIDPLLSRQTSQPQIFTTALTPPAEKTRSTFGEYYETSMVNNTLMGGSPQLDISGISNGYKTTSIVAPSLTGGNIKVDINHEIIRKDCGSSGNGSFYSAAVSPVLERSVTIGIQQNRENMRLDNLSMTPPKVTITRVEQQASPFSRSRISRAP